MTTCIVLFILLTYILSFIRRVLTVYLNGEIYYRSKNFGLQFYLRKTDKRNLIEKSLQRIKNQLEVKCRYSKTSVNMMKSRFYGISSSVKNFFGLFNETFVRFTVSL